MRGQVPSAAGGSRFPADFAQPERQVGERLLVCSGPVMLVLFVAGIWPLAGFVPPPLAGADAAVIGARFAADRGGILAGGLAVMVAAPLLATFCVAVSAAMRRGTARYDLLAQAQLCCGALNAILFLAVGLCWTAGAFRADMPAENVRLLNDVAWLIMVVPTGPFVIQLLAVATVALTGGALPRPYGFYNLFCVGLATPGMFSGFFHQGPIAWHGILSFWAEAVDFAVWLIVTTYVLFRRRDSTIS